MDKSKAGKKAISPIIAIIIILLITISIAGAAYSYISIYWASTVGQNLAVVDAYPSGNEANLIVRNTGTRDITLDNVKILDSTGREVQGDWTTIEGQEITQLEPGKVARFNTTCMGYCTYRIVYGGIGSQPIPVEGREPACGNGIKEFGEACDVGELSGETCQTLGFTHGTLACLSNCSDFDTTVCAELVSHYKFEGNANDETGANNGIGYGTPGYVPGVSGNAIRLNRTNGVEVPDSPSLDIRYAISLLAWVKYGSFYGHGKIVIKPYDLINTPPWELYSLDLKQNDSLNTDYPTFIITDGIPGGEGVILSNQSYDLSLNGWYHVAGTYDGRLMKLYVNGTLIAANPANLTIGTNNVSFFIGGVPGLPFHTTGSIDEVMIFNGPLNETDIRQIYCDQGGSAEFC